MKLGTLLFLFDQRGRVLLGLKKAGFGAGKWNGFGGKIMPGENKEAAAVREMFEESGLAVESKELKLVSEVDFYFAGNHAFRVFVFFAWKWSGQEIETKEMKPQWFRLIDVPYQEMWAGDSKWLSLVFAGQKIRARIDFDETGNQLINFSWQEFI